MKAGLRRGRTGMMLALWFVVPAAAIPSTVRVRVAAPGRTIDLPLERYVAAVVAGESSVFRSAEALKAMAVAARTYAVRFRGRHLRDGFDFCDTAHCQRADLNAITRRIEVAVAETAG